jgi:hypothetical protein
VVVVAAVVVVAQGLSCAVAVACGVEELDEALLQVSCVAAEVVDAVLEQTLEQRLAHGPCCLRVYSQNRRSF